ncbi:unnamed protein product [Rhodiola kirilowii]
MASLTSNNMVTLLFLIFLVVSNRHTTVNAVSCAPIVTSLTPCIGYLLTGGALSVACCRGITRISTVANSTSDRQATCDCVKKAIGSIPGLKPGRLPPLPNKCGVKLPFQVSLNTDCSK